MISTTHKLQKLKFYMSNIYVNLFVIIDTVVRYSWFPKVHIEKIIFLVLCSVFTCDF